MNEAQAAKKYLFATLTGAAAVTALVSTRIYDSAAPQDAVLPYVVYSLNSGRDLVASAAHRLTTALRFSVLAWGEGGSYSPEDAIASAVDDALDQTSGTATVGAQAYTILSCYREETLCFARLDAGRRIQASVGVFQVLVTTCT